MIVVTGAAGFIGSCLVSWLLKAGYKDIIAVDDFTNPEKQANLAEKAILDRVNRQVFIKDWFTKHAANVTAVFHLGARTDTAEQSTAIFDTLNLNYSKSVWEVCTAHQIPMIYASSAATYGDGKLGYRDNHTLPFQLKPLNPYGVSKNDFDQWALQQTETPPNWYGMKFFNVYGPNEYHKGRMASVVFHCFNQILDTGGMKLFRSHHPDFADGEQQRDFIYVKDVLRVCQHLFERLPENGLYNVGNGMSCTFFDLASTTFRAMGRQPNISFIDTPEDIRATYQYYTEADMVKFYDTGYSRGMLNIQEAIPEYVKEYLMKRRFF